MEQLTSRIELAAHDASVGFNPRYSGRGMYGRACVSIWGPESECRSIVAEVVRDITMEAVNLELERHEGDGRADHPTDADLLHDRTIDALLEQQRQVLYYSLDRMGRDICLYWPNLRETAE